MKLHDVVKVKEDIPEENLEKGMSGVIVTVLRDPCLAYEVEFCDENGRTVTETALLPEQIGLERQIPADHSDTNTGKKDFLIPVDELLAGRLTEIAESRQIPPEMLIELWLKEKISESYQQA